jgi:uncharacterized protein YndB with AHSA1/START domain
MGSVLGAEFRRVEDREHLGKTAVVVVATRSYDTSSEDLWEAIAEPERLRRWFLPVEGELKLGGRYQLQGNAGGTILRCEPPRALELSWEFAGATSWVHVYLEPRGERTQLTLEHLAHSDGPGEEHMKKYGPGAVGVGWDLTLYGLGKHLLDPRVAVDHAEAEAWSLSPEGKAFSRASGEAWAAAYIANGADPDQARAQAEQTIAFYTGG